MKPEDLEEMGKAFERCGKEIGIQDFPEGERIVLEKKLCNKKSLTGREEKWLSGFKFRAMGAIMQGDAVNARKLINK